MEPAGWLSRRRSWRRLLDPNWIDDTDFDCDIKGARLTVVWIHCDRETLKGRIVNRGAGRDRWKLSRPGLSGPTLSMSRICAPPTFVSTTVPTQSRR